MSGHQVQGLELSNLHILTAMDLGYGSVSLKAFSQREVLYRSTNESTLVPKPWCRVSPLPGTATQSAASFPLPANSYASQFYIL